MVWVDKDSFAFRQLMKKSAAWLRDSKKSPAATIEKGKVARELEELVDACVPGEFKSDEAL
jgi:hypothetical protein